MTSSTVTSESSGSAPDLRYPIGRFRKPASFGPEQRTESVGAIAAAPAQLRDAVAGLSEGQLDTPYRAGGWTIRQVVHHLPDSHLNSYLRFKLALTEAEPTIKTYDEGRWAELDDARTAPLEPSLRLLESLHERWVTLLRSLTAVQLDRTLRNPELGILSLHTMVAIYAWHGRHHIAHITSLRGRHGW